MIEITEYWQKVSDETPTLRKVLPGYEIKSQYRINNTLADLKKRWKNHPRMTLTRDMIVEDCGRAWGIHRYTEIREI